jgi:hypothetical protein
VMIWKDPSGVSCMPCMLAIGAIFIIA